MRIAKKISGGMLSAVKDAEASLARKEAAELEQGIPEGHPLREEANKQKALLGDLSGLPVGHPLVRAMQAAKERYDQQQAQRTEEQNKSATIRKAKKVDDDRVKREARRVEDEQSELRMSAANKINTGIDGVLGDVRQLYRAMTDHEEILNMDPISRGRVSRLKRLLFAVERGISECRFSKVRA